MPATAQAPPAADTVRRELLRRVFLRQTAAFTLLAIGGVVSFFGPIIMAMIVWFTLLVLGHWISFWPIFAIALAVMLPLAFWTEFRTRGTIRSFVYFVFFVAPETPSNQSTRFTRARSHARTDCC